MYEKTLESRLLQIFGIKKVEFDSYKLGRDQEILWCNVFDCNVRFGDTGHERAIVTGQLEISAAKGKLFCGWLHKQTLKNTNRDFWFSPYERDIHFEDNGKVFTKYSMEFAYFYDGQFNPPISEIEEPFEITVTTN